MMQMIHAKRKHHGNKGQNRPQQNNGSQYSNGVSNDTAVLPQGFEVAFKWVAVQGERISPKENKGVYAEYNDVRAELLKATVYNADGSENKEGISRLKQAGLNDKAIYESIGKGKTPNGFNYHHLFPRALSGSFKHGPVQFGDETLTTIHDWRALMPLSNANGADIHGKVHQAMEERNGPLPNVGKKVKYYIAMPLTAAEYEKYKENPASLKEDLLIVGANSYRTIENAEHADKKPSKLKPALMQKLAARGR